MEQLTWAILISYIVIGVPVFGALWRIRGGWLGLPSSQLARACFSIPFGLYTVLLTGDWWGMLMAPAIHLGMVMPWAQWMDMNHVEENDDLTGMTGRGFLVTAAGSVLLAVIDPGPAAYIFLMGGSMLGPIYAASWDIFKGGTEAAEVMYGGWLAALLWFCVIWL
jgi:hypothetical protein